MKKHVRLFIVFIAILALSAAPIHAANLKKFIAFTVQWEGDGSNKTVVIDFLVDPISFTPPSGTFLSPVFSVASSLPKSISNVTVGGATFSSSSYNSTLGQLTVTFTANPTNGSIGNISGYAEYN